MTAPTEREIAFGVPDDAWPALAREMAEAGVHGQLHAIYYDTADGALGRAGVSLRVRREGPSWVQTLKASGKHPLERIEDSVPVAPVRGDLPPTPDPLVHRSREARKQLRLLLGADPQAGACSEPLAPIFEARVDRWTRRVRHGACEIELALDDGVLRAGERQQVVRELELEILSGDLPDLLDLARQWRERHDLWLQSASKAARGYRLAAGEAHAPPTTASIPDWPRKPKLGEFTASVLEACLAQVIDNASELAGGSEGEDHIHQIRVGIRRLRTALRELPGLDSAIKQHEPALVDAFRALGARRDRTHVLEQVRAEIEAAGGKPLSPGEETDDASPGDAVRSAAFQDALLALLACAAECRAHPGKAVKRAVEPRLAKLHAQVKKDGRRFDRLPEAQQHRVRKRLKRLRYLAEFVAPLYGGRETRRFLAAIKPAQEALGTFNDERVAQALYEEAARDDPTARFGAQWLAERHEAQLLACRASLRKLAKAKRFWT